MEKKCSNYTDLELWQNFKKGDENAFDCIFENHVRLLYNYGRKFTATTTIIEDCIQDLFIELWEKKSLLSDTDSIKYYLFKSLRLKIIKRLALESKQQNSHFHADLYEFSIHFSHESALISAQLGEEQSKLLVQALENLSNRQQEALQLKYYDGLSSDQIASIMGIHVNSVYKLISGALMLLKKKVRQVYLILFWCNMLWYSSILF